MVFNRFCPRAYTLILPVIATSNADTDDVTYEVTHGVFNINM